MSEKNFIKINKLIEEKKINEAQFELSKLGNSYNENPEYLYLRSKIFFMSKLYYIAIDTLLIALDLDGVAVSTGSACSSGTGLPSYVLQAMGISDEIINSSIRFSLGENTSKLQIDSVVETLIKTVGLNKTVIL